MASSFQKADFENCKDDVMRKLIEVFQDDKDTLAHVLFILNAEHNIYTDEEYVRVWNTLIANLHSDQLLRNYARNLVHGTAAEEEFVTYAEEKVIFGQQDQCFDIDDWKANIRCKLFHVFLDDPQALDRILILLEKEDLSATSHVWESLKSNLFNDSHFENYARSLLQDEEEEATETSCSDDPASLDMDNWKGQIRVKLVEVFQDDSDTLTRILYYLDEEESMYGEAAIPPAWQTLKDYLNIDELFVRSANNFAEETEEAERNKKYLENMSQFYEMIDFWNESKACGQSSDLTEEAAFDDPKNEIRAKLMEVFKDDYESLARILFYLDEEDKFYKNSTELPPAWKTLFSSRLSDDHFKTYATALAEDTKTAEQDEKFRETMNNVSANMADVSNEPEPDDHGQGFYVSWLYKVSPTDAIGFAKMVWSLLPANSHEKILEKIARKLSKAVQSGSNAVVSGATMGISTGLKSYTFTAFRSLCRWWKGEISGKRLLKNLLDSALTITAGVAVPLICGVIGGPAVVALDLVGGTAFAQAISFLGDRFTQWLFNIPRDEALENAYNFLGIPMRASNHELHIAYRTLCLKYHPDKLGASAENFHKLQLYMTIIKTERGNMTPVTPDEIQPITYDN